MRIKLTQAMAALALLGILAGCSSDTWLAKNAARTRFLQAVESCAKQNDLMVYYPEPGTEPLVGPFVDFLANEYRKRFDKCMTQKEYREPGS